jgi:hypothetical protein
MSIRALAEKYGVHRCTVREAIDSLIPPPRKDAVRSAVVLDGVRGLIDAMLVADLVAPRKQRHTAKRIYERLHAEHGAAVSYSYVAKYVRHRRREVLAQAVARDAARAGVVVGFVPQQHPPGAQAEVDFADLWVRLARAMTECFLFTLRLSHSGRAVRVRTRRAGSRATGAGSAAPIWFRCPRSTRWASSTRAWSRPTWPRTSAGSTGAPCRCGRRSPPKLRC